MFSRKQLHAIVAALVAQGVIAFACIGNEPRWLSPVAFFVLAIDFGTRMHAMTGLYKIQREHRAWKANQAKQEAAFRRDIEKHFDDEGRDE